MHNSGKMIKATIIDLIVAFLFVLIVVLGVNVIFGQEIDMAMTLATTVSVDTKSEEKTNTIITDNSLENYPEYGSNYGTIEIPKINANLDLYYGDTLDILKKGVGHSSGSYFPGEGGSIVYMGHNSKKVFRRFSELQKGDTIKVSTTYGEFNYKIYDMQVVKETETEKLPIQKEKETLMVYTCYPFNNIGYTTQRYVVYANRVEE